MGDLVVTIVPPPEMNAEPVRLHDRTGGRGRELRRTYDALVRRG
ncbi:hypothetical protein [Catellatospora sichuanensis]|nr:hypothetical protein [Catellatospora sichuanensis]